VGGRSLLHPRVATAASFANAALGCLGRAGEATVALLALFCIWHTLPGSSLSTTGVYDHRIKKMAQASPGPPAPAVNTALCDDDTDDGKMTAADKSRLEAATAAEQQGGRQTEKNASTPSKRGRFTLELVEERRHHYQHTEQQLYVTHANCDLALSPAPSSSLAVITPQQRKFVKKVGRFVVEEDVDVETTTNSESGSGSTARAPSRRRIGRFEVAPHEGSGSVTPSLMVYPVLE
ncbi:hypothetical protein FOZ63_010984, partial [Perkinsus olseni]